MLTQCLYTKSANISYDAQDAVLAEILPSQLAVTTLCYQQFYSSTCIYLQADCVFM